MSYNERLCLGSGLMAIRSGSAGEHPDRQPLQRPARESPVVRTTRDTKCHTATAMRKKTIASCHHMGLSSLVLGSVARTHSNQYIPDPQPISRVQPVTMQHTLLTKGTKHQVGLAVQMTHRHDRFVAEFQFRLDHLSWVPVLRSVEGGDGRRWPPSPPIQQLTRQENEAGGFLAGVGMAGNSHWSLSMVAIEAESPALEFDVACRVQSDPEWLGSTYQILRGQPIESQTGARLVLGEYALQLEPVANVGACDVNIGNAQLCVASRPLNGPLPWTARWKYRISLVPNPF